MLAESLPPCPTCNQCSYQVGGTTLSSGSLQQWFACRVCNISVYLLNQHGAAYLFYTTRAYDESSREREDRERHDCPRPAPIDWLNNVVLVTLRDWEHRREERRKQLWLEFLSGFLERHNVQESEPGCIKYSDLPTQEAKDEIDAFDASSRMVPGFLDSPPLPKIPPGVVVLRGTQEGWAQQDQVSSWDLEVPPDPVTVQNAAFWKEVFDKVGVVEATEIPNGYRNAPNEPWFRFVVGSFLFEVGRRKRVLSITATSTTEHDFNELFELAREDEVTFELDGEFGTKRGASARGKAVTIHAWGLDKCVEYLNSLLKVARAA